MGVLKAFRGLSSMEFYKNAIFIRKDLTMWLIKDFGLNKYPRSVKQVIKNISEEDQKIIDNVFIKYNINPKKEYCSELPTWFLSYEKRLIYDKMFELIDNITKANSIYPSIELEWNLRRKYQDIAISICYVLYQELAYIISLFPTDLNRLEYIINSIKKEIDLLKGWRQSDNNRRKKGQI